MILNGLFQQELKSINIGLISFKEALDAAEYKCIQVDWKPPAAGDDEALAALKAIAGL